MKRAGFKPCLLCGKGVAHDSGLLFYRVRISRLGLKLNAIQQRHGLELMLGSPQLAEVMGPDDDLAQTILSHDFLVCDPCAMESDHCLAELSERAGEREEPPVGEPNA